VGTTLRTIGTLLAAFCLAACSGASQDNTVRTGPPLETSTAGGAPGATTVPRQAPPSRLVAVVGKHRTDAIDLLSSLGAKYEVETRAGCATDVVVAQGPGPRQVTRSELVTIVVETGGGRRACDLTRARDQATALLDWARNQGPPPSFAEGVEFLLGNNTVERRLATPLNGRSWELCEHGEGCQSPLTVLAGMARPELVRVMRGRCPDSYSLLRRGLASTLGSSVTVVDRRASHGCEDVRGVQVWVDGAGRISAVNWVL